MNLTAGFRALFDAPADGPVTLHIAASTIYRVLVNGEYGGHGPARGPHGWFRVDVWDITGHLRPGRNLVAIEVAGYNANSFAYLDQPSFLQAEIVARGRVLAATGDDESGFVCASLPERVQKVQRYSFQRPFSEVYRLTPGYEGWRSKPDAGFEVVSCAVQERVRLLPRGVAYPNFDRKPAVWHVASGELKPGQKVEHVWKDRSLTDIDAVKLKGYPESELELIPSIKLQSVGSTETEKVDRPLSAEAALALKPATYHLLDFGANLTGFIGMELDVRRTTELHVTFDEILTAGDVDFKRLGCVNIVSLFLRPGKHRFETMEPYTLRYMKLMALAGDCEVSRPYLRELAGRTGDATFACSDSRLMRLFEAGVQTFRQNALDVFMDCPSRERAGWLCDSFFTSRVALDLLGDTSIERNFYENYLLPKKFPFLPPGMLPMCYPSDHNDGVYIPNWAMWFVIELEEYLARSGDRALVDALKPRVLALLEFLGRYRNDQGLLEKLPSWVFVEWSAANNFVQDVNYPSNMLYAGVLGAAGRMYGLDALTADAERVRETIRKQSFDGSFFVDNAVRKDGKLEVTRNRTETCQYYAFFFDVARPETHSELWKALTEQFGPKRVERKLLPEIHPSNSFIGNMLRVEILSRAGRSQQILDESIDYLLYMSERTGTLWENVGAQASCNHGFASHVVHTLYRDIVGLRSVDRVGRVIRFGLADVKLDWCEARMPTPDGPISIRWWREGDQVSYRLDAPAGYRVEESHGASLQVNRRP